MDVSISQLWHLQFKELHRKGREKTVRARYQEVCCETVSYVSNLVDQTELWSPAPMATSIHLRVREYFRKREGKIVGARGSEGLL